MNFRTKIFVETTIYGAIGLGFGRATWSCVPSEAAYEALKVLGSIAAISGSLLGWSAAWLDQSRQLLKEVDYNAGVRLFTQLGESQKKLIWRWGIALTSSMLTVICSLFVKSTDTDIVIVRVGYLVGAGSFSIAVFSIFSLFRSLLKLADLKAQLEENARQESRRLRNLPKELVEKKEENEKVAA